MKRLMLKPRELPAAIDIQDIALYKGEQEVKTDETDPEAQDLDQE
jgi:hypothetical protein